MELPLKNEYNNYVQLTTIYFIADAQRKNRKGDLFVEISLLYARVCEVLKIYEILWEIYMFENVP